MLRIRVRKHQLALRFVHGDFVDVLRPGVHYDLRSAFGASNVERIDTRVSRFEHELVATLDGDSPLWAELHVLDLADSQRAVMWKNGRVEALLGPGRHAYWRRPFDLEFEVFDVGPGPFEHPKLEDVLAHRGASEFLRAVRVGPNERVLFERDGESVADRSSGVVAFWRQASDVTWTSFDLREQTIDVGGQEIMTADRVSLRTNLVVSYRIRDPLRVHASVSNAEQALYREAQLALRASIGGRTLDELLGSKESVGAEIQGVVAERGAAFGVEVTGAGLRDLILPGEMKSILNQVVEAEKRAEANLIRRREDTAAARSQANTAKLLANHPELARMRELEALQEILAGSRATFLFGSGDIARQVRSLVEASGDESGSDA